MISLIRFAKLERLLALICLFTPLILRIVTGEFRASISDYAYMEHSQVYVFLLTLASALFLFNGIIYLRRWYNVVFGICLVGLVLFQTQEFTLLHNIFALVFFLGSAIVIIIYTQKGQRWITTWIGLAIAVSFLLHCIGFISLLVAEWISLTIIAVHYILESYKSKA